MAEASGRVMPFEPYQRQAMQRWRETSELLFVSGDVFWVANGTRMDPDYEV